VSYILSSFYYASLEHATLEFLRAERIPEGFKTTPGEEVDASSNLELNCPIMLTDDYFLMTTSKNNAMLMIEKMYGLSKVSNFKFNKEKLKTNFYLNLQKIVCSEYASLDEQNEKTTMLNWIGISINKLTLYLIPNINVKKEAVLCTLNVNLQTTQSIMWLKKRLKS
jgi:hypothetical protein